jgi:tetratricopeptide (TPR) repeat protein
LGLVAANDDNDIEAVTNFRKAVAGKPVLLPALNNLAWLLVTSTNQTVRNVEQGLQYARQLNEYTQYRSAEALTTLARAWQEAGDLENAGETLQKAIDIEMKQNNQQRVDELRERLDHLEQESSND